MSIFIGLISTPGYYRKLDADMVQQCSWLAEIVCDTGVILLPNFSVVTIDMLCVFLGHHRKNPAPEIRPPFASYTLAQLVHDKWDVNFITSFDLAKDTLVELADLAEVVGCTALIDLCVCYFATELGPLPPPNTWPELYRFIQEHPWEFKPTASDE